MKFLIFLAGVVSAGNLLAQTNQVSESGIRSSSPAESARRQENASCELHIFPTNEIIDSSPNYNGAQPSILGALVGGAISAAQSSGSGKLRATALEQMQTYLTPEDQINELKDAGVLSTLKLPPDTKIVDEDVLPAPFGSSPKDPVLLKAYKEYWIAMKKGTTIKTSASPCYRELIISSISISKGLGSLKFSSAFVYRTFNDQHSETHLFDGEHSVPKPERFPAQSSDAVSDARAALRTAFTQNFSEWVAHRVKF
jgi:hypothetical protein